MRKDIYVSFTGYPTVSETSEKTKMYGQVLSQNILRHNNKI